MLLVVMRMTSAPLAHFDSRSPDCLPDSIGQGEVPSPRRPSHRRSRARFRSPRASFQCEAHQTTAAPLVRLPRPSIRQIVALLIEHLTDLVRWPQPQNLTAEECGPSRTDRWPVRPPRRSSMTPGCARSGSDVSGDRRPRELRSVVARWTTEGGSGLIIPRAWACRRRGRLSRRPGTP